MRMWGRPNSLNTQKVLWALAELRLDCERVDAGLQFGVNNTPEYRAMNPNGLVPTLEDGGLILWESNVIVRYLASRYGAGTLYPATVAERFIAEQWMDWQQTSLNPPIGTVFMHLHRLPPDRRDPAQIEKSRAAAEPMLAILDQRLAESAWLGGENFSMADIPAGTSVSRWYKLPLAREPHPHVERWLMELKRRPAFKAHIDVPLS
ncbi:MAG TPA: glutathione S-transferase [Bauldia sp.]|nr:glutathione S-transferase [Bauldia sp.]